MFTKLYEKFKKFIKENYQFLLAVLFLVFFFYYELPYVVYRPGGTIDLSSRVEVENQYETKGSLSMAYVSMMKGNIPFVLLSFVLPNWDLESKQEVVLDEHESVNDSIKRDRLLLEEGLANATISAYHLAEKTINIKKIEHAVLYITEEAETDLKIGDTLLKVNGEEIENLEALQQIIQTFNKGDMVSFMVRRDGKEKECSAKVYEVEGTLKVGISILNRYEYEEEPKLTIKTKSNESGSSGGLMTALSIYNALTEEDITKGRNIVGTGSIDMDGNVSEIGGVKYKVLGASKAHADIFICPKENYEEALKIKEQNNLNLEIIGVGTLEEAIQNLQN